MLNDFRLALLALFEPVAWRVVVFGLFLASGVLILLATLVAWAIMATDVLPWQNWEWVGGTLGFLLMLVAGYFMFAPIFSACAGLFTEYVADKVEQRYYPHLPPARHVGVAEQITTGLDFARRSVMRNMMALPFYIIPGFNLLAFILTNRSPMAYEYYMTVALRRYTPAVAAELYQSHETTLKRTGTVIALIFITPVLNLVAPVVATALMTHKAARIAP